MLIESWASSMRWPVLMFESQQALEDVTNRGLYTHTFEKEAQIVSYLITYSQWLGRFLGIIGWDPSVHLQVQLVTCWHPSIFYINLRYISYISLKWLVILLKSWTSTNYFSNSTGSSVTNCWFSLIIALSMHVLIKKMSCATNFFRQHLSGGRFCKFSVA